MTLNTIDGIIMKIRIYLLTYFYKCRWSPLTDLHANPLTNEVPAQISPLWLPLALELQHIEFNQIIIKCDIMSIN